MFSHSFALIFTMVGAICKCGVNQREAVKMTTTMIPEDTENTATYRRMMCLDCPLALACAEDTASSGAKPLSTMASDFEDAAPIPKREFCAESSLRQRSKLSSVHAEYAGSNGVTS